MPGRRVEEREKTIISVQPREELSAVNNAEQDIMRFKGFSELTPEGQVSVIHYAGTVAEFWSRRVYAYRLPDNISRDNLYGSFVPIEQVLEEEELLQILGVPQRLIRAANLIAEEKVIKIISER